MPRRVWKKIVDEKDKARMTKVKREKRRIQKTGSRERNENSKNDKEKAR